MSLSKIQSAVAAQTTVGTSFTAFFNVTVTAGNLMVVTIEHYGSFSDTFSVVDSNGNAFNSLGTYFETTNNLVASIFWLQASKGNISSVTVTRSNSSSRTAVHIYEVSSSTGGTWTLNGVAGANNASLANPSAGTVTTTTNPVFLVSALITTVGASGVSEDTAGAGWTLTSNQFLGATPNLYGVSESQIVTGIGSYSGTYTNTNARAWAGIIAGFTAVGKTPTGIIVFHDIFNNNKGSDIDAASWKPGATGPFYYGNIGFGAQNNNSLVKFSTKRLEYNPAKTLGTRYVNGLSISDATAYNNYTVTAEVSALGAGATETVGVAARLDSSLLILRGYVVVAYPKWSAPDLRLYRYDAGVFTLLNSNDYLDNFPAGVLTINLNVVGSLITFWVTGYPIHQFVDTTYPDGIPGFSVENDSPLVTVYMNSLKVYNLLTEDAGKFGGVGA